MENIKAVEEVLKKFFDELTDEEVKVVERYNEFLEKEVAPLMEGK